MTKRRIDYEHLPTEQPHADLRHLDTLSESALVDMIQKQDRLALQALESVQPAIVAAVHQITSALQEEGRLIYVGAGTSGRLAAVDAAECPPTFGTAPSQVVAVMAGGTKALRRATEGSEDDAQDARQQMRRLQVAPPDVVCGVTASGVTAFVGAALSEAHRRKCRTIVVTCVAPEVLRCSADIVIAVDVGAETVAGSTRMKAGLVTKAILHTLTTASMIRLGKVYDNLMVDVQPTSDKLAHRAARIVSQLTGLERPEAEQLLELSGGRPKVAAVMYHRGVGRRAAVDLLSRANGRVRDVLGDVTIPESI